MKAVLILALVLDFALGALLVATSGFVLEGVNRELGFSWTAVAFVGMILFCFAAPVAAIALDRRGARGRAVVGIAYAPLAVAAIALASEPAFV